jgi:hypothetical protein
MLSSIHVLPLVGCSVCLYWAATSTGTHFSRKLRTTYPVLTPLSYFQVAFKVFLKSCNDLTGASSSSAHGIASGEHWAPVQEGSNQAEDSGIITPGFLLPLLEFGMGLTGSVVQVAACHDGSCC